MAETVVRTATYGVDCSKRFVEGWCWVSSTKRSWGVIPYWCMQCFHLQNYSSKVHTPPVMDEKSLMVDFPNSSSIVLTYPQQVLFLSMSWLKIRMEGKIWQSSFSSAKLVNRITCMKWYLVNRTVLGIFLFWNMTNVKSIFKVTEMGCYQNWSAN